MIGIHIGKKSTNIARCRGTKRNAIGKELSDKLLPRQDNDVGSGMEAQGIGRATKATRYRKRLRIPLGS